MAERGDAMMDSALGIEDESFSKNAIKSQLNEGEDLVPTVYIEKVNGATGVAFASPVEGQIETTQMETTDSGHSENGMQKEGDGPLSTPALFQKPDYVYITSIKISANSEENQRERSQSIQSYTIEIEEDLSNSIIYSQKARHGRHSHLESDEGDGMLEESMPTRQSSIECLGTDDIYDSLDELANTPSDNMEDTSKEKKKKNKGVKAFWKGITHKIRKKNKRQKENKEPVQPSMPRENATCSSCDSSTNKHSTRIPKTDTFPDKSVYPHNRQYDEPVPMPGTSSYSLEIPMKSPEIQAVKEDYIKSIENVSSYLGLMENLKDIDPVHGVLGPFMKRKDPSVVGPYQASLEIMDKITAWICQNHETFAGDYVGIGSFHDGTKIGRANEYDFLFQLRNTSFQVLLNDKDNLTFKVLPGTTLSETFSEMCGMSQSQDILLSGKLYETFAKHVNQGLSTIKLPRKMRHAGFCSPRFSGVRKCGPAVTLQVYYQHRADEEVLITIDITPALRVSREHLQQVEIQWPLPISDQLRKATETPQIHLIPSERRSLFKLSTAKLEVDFMGEHLAREGKVRRTIQTVKNLHDKYLTVRLEGTEDERTKKRTDITKVPFAEKCLVEGNVLHQARILSEQNKLTELLLSHRAWRESMRTSPRDDMESDMDAVEDILRGEMLGGWSAVDPATLSIANEMSEACISTKSCVVKYSVLDLFFNGSLSDTDHSTPNPSLISEILQRSRKEEVTHPLLQIKIKTKKISAYAERNVSGMFQSDWIEFHDEIGLKLLDKVQSMTEKMSIPADGHRVVGDENHSSSGSSEQRDNYHTQPVYETIPLNDVQYVHPPQMRPEPAALSFSHGGLCSRCTGIAHGACRHHCSCQPSFCLGHHHCSPRPIPAIACIEYTYREPTPTVHVCPHSQATNPCHANPDGATPGMRPPTRHGVSGLHANTTQGFTGSWPGQSVTREAYITLNYV